MPRKEQNW